MTVSQAATPEPEVVTKTAAPVKTVVERPSEFTVENKLTGRDLLKSVGFPKTIVAPMVDQSELAWRLISRKYGADLCYTPMFHARLFGEDKRYREDQFGPLDGDANVDRPLIVQFCANDPEELLKAAKYVVGRCDAVDLNLGCPQGIAKKGKYGAFLMEDWDLIYRLINILHTKLEIPVTAKIRIYETKEKTLEYAKMVLSAGAQFLTVHGRTREMKGQLTGLADWSYIRYVRDNLPPDTVIFANGNVLYSEDIDRSLEATKADAVMSAESNLYNPGVFNVNKPGIDDQFPRVDKLLREYFETAKSTPGNASQTSMKSHFFKVLQSFLPKHLNIRNAIGPIRKGQYDQFEDVVKQVEEIVEGIYEKVNKGELEDKVITLPDGYKSVPYWRCQPYFRVVNGVLSNGKRKADVDPEAAQRKKEAKLEKEKAAAALASLSSDGPQPTGDEAPEPSN
ncbi:Dus1p [Sugiyamaella lignohabitans]|uniref:tRNA-dihydrouridine(16/17) synthase [NAD(P)(+)] n=1 Tax=Sugiyamaella lignohabitans TaxID=796027 RepID=A0A167E9N2_9ASCO|nr:Dus1p [Sugiyamaella lignohabitans]ANB13811.1 Dus1p [Sugiyamaella lignohabitans]